MVTITFKEKVLSLLPASATGHLASGDYYYHLINCSHGPTAYYRCVSFFLATMSIVMQL